MFCGRRSWQQFLQCMLVLGVHAGIASLVSSVKSPFPVNSQQPVPEFEPKLQVWLSLDFSKALSQISAVSPAPVCKGLAAGSHSLAAFSPLPADTRSSSSARPWCSQGS